MEQGDNYPSLHRQMPCLQNGNGQKFEIDRKIINCDAYYYFENKISRQFQVY